MNNDRTRRAIWRERWLSSIQEFADDQTQRRMWLDLTNTNPHYSPVEYFACYFDDLGLSVGKYQSAVNEGLLSSDEAAAVLEFHSVADAYSAEDMYDYEAVLADRKWTEVVVAAKRAQTMLLELIDDPVERRALTEP